MIREEMDPKNLEGDPRLTKIKPIMPSKTLDIISRRRYVPNTQHYFTNRKIKASDTRKAKHGQPFKVPRSEKLLCFMKYSDKREKLESTAKLSKPLHLKDNINIALTRDISERLFLEEPVNDVRTVLELHPEFYSVIEGRPLRAFDDIKVYLNNIRMCAMLRQQIGYRNDIIMQIDKSLVEETQEYDVILLTYKKHVKNFEHFLREDYQKSVVRIMKAEKVLMDLNAKISEFYGYVSSITILNNVIFKLDAIRNVLKMYRKYLFFVAPLSWRQKYDDFYRKKTCAYFDSETEKSAMEENTEAEKIIEKAAIELRNPPKAILYFKNPDEMMYLFRSLELQCREYLIHLSRLDGPMSQLTERITQLRLAMTQEQDHFEYYIQSITAAIEREQQSEIMMNKLFFDILNGPFFETVASPDSLKLKICIEYVFEQVFGKSEDIHHNIREPMKVLELMYEEYNLKLDSLDFKIVNQARNDCFAQDLKMMKLAYLAARQLKNFQETSNLIRKAFLPPKKTIRIKPEPRQRKTKAQEEQSKADQEKKSVQLTDADRLNLELFTEWCEGQDPTPFMKEYEVYVKSSFE